MRLHGKLYSDAVFETPLIGWAADADNEDRLVKVEFRVRGNAVVLVPVLTADEEPVTATPDGKQEVPEQRRVPLRGDDFK